MQLFPCPFCGLRDETEFHFAVETGKPRPEPTDETTAREWAAYLYDNANRKGPSEEVWVHLTCGEFFVMTRNTVTHEVAGTTLLPGRGQ